MSKNILLIKGSDCDRSAPMIFSSSEGRFLITKTDVFFHRREKGFEPTEGVDRMGSQRTMGSDTPTFFRKFCMM